MKSAAAFVHACLDLIWMVIFQPRSVIREGIFDRHVRQHMTTLAIIILIVVPLLITLGSGLLSSFFGYHFDLSHRLINVGIGVVIGMVVSVVVGVVVGTMVSVLVRICGALIGGLLVCSMFGVEGDRVLIGMQAEMDGHARLGSQFGMMLGAMFAVVFAMTFGLIIGMSDGMASGLLIGLGSGVLIGTLGSKVFGKMGALIIGGLFGVVGNWPCSVGFLLGYFRLFLYPYEIWTTFRTLMCSRYNSEVSQHLLDRSSACLDEVMHLPQPFLSQLLVSIGERDPTTFKQVITYLTNYTFQQRAAKNAVTEWASRDMLRRQSIEDIALFEVPTELVTLFKTVDEDVSTAQQRCTQIRVEVATALAATSNYQKLAGLNRACRQLDDLRTFAVTKLRGSASRVYVQVAQQWQEAINAEIDKLTAQEQTAESIPNPYIAPRPLSITDDVFVGRTEIFRFIEEQFLRSDRNIPIILHGQPRIGKSSILRHLTLHLPTNLIAVYVDMQRAAQVESTGGLLYNLADAISQQLQVHGLKLSPPTLTDYSVEPFIVFGKFLDTVEREIRSPENRIVFALDEFEEIERKLTEGKISLDLLPYLRSMMQHRQGIALLFAGTHTLEEMIQEYWAPYFRSALPCRVSYLEVEEARKLITNPIPSFTLDYEPEAVAYLIEQTYCHPCLIQLTCSALVDAKNAKRSHLATHEDVDQALAKALEMGDYVFRGIWDWIPQHEQKLLVLLAPQRIASSLQISQALSVAEPSVRRSLERLAQVEIVQQISSTNDQPVYRFAVELFRQWVERHAPIDPSPVSATAGVHGLTS